MPNPRSPRLSNGRSAKLTAMDDRPRIIRSMVFVPAHEPAPVLEVADRDPDAVCLDLEDLTPMDAKEQARAAFADIAAGLVARGALVMARVNGVPTGMAEADLAAVVGPDLHCVQIPKAESADDVVAFCALLEAAERAAGVEVGSTLVRPVIETAPGVRFAYEIATASDRVTYMGGVSGGWWGDISSDVGYEPTTDGRETAYVRAKVLADVRAAGVLHPIGGGSLAKGATVADIRAYWEENRTLGYEGVHCNSQPDVIAAANEVFAPRPADIEAWLAVLPTLEEAEAAGRTAIRIDGAFYDLAGLVKVRRQLDLARRLGMLD